MLQRHDVVEGGGQDGENTSKRIRRYSGSWRIYRERIEEIRQKARKELDSPPDALTPAERKETGKRTDVASDAAAFVRNI